MRTHNESNLKQVTHAWQQALEHIEQNQLYPRFPVVSDGIGTPKLTIDGKPYLTFASNNYLGLACDPRTKESAIEGIQQYGPGPGHSRAIGGTPQPIFDLEQEIANWTGFEDCLTFPTGYMANLGVFLAVLRPIFTSSENDPPIVLIDQYCHGSILDGCQLAGAKIVRFRHNDLEDLEAKIKRYGTKAKLVVTEEVFCLEGTMIDLPAYSSVAHENGCMLMVDDAHGIGILGPEGGGIGSLHHDSGLIDIYMGCMDKALGATGGFLCGSHELVRFLRVACRSSILSSCLPVGTACGVRKAIEIIRTEPQIRQKLLESSEMLRNQLKYRAFTVLGDIAHPAVSVFIGSDKDGIEIERFLWEQGIYQPIVRWPAVAENRCRFRVNLTTLHRTDHMERFIQAISSI